MNCALGQFCACVKKHKNSVFIKIFIVVLGCFLLCFLCIAVDSGRADRRRDQRVSTAKLIQLKWKRPTKPPIIENHIDTDEDDLVEDGSGHFVHESEILTYPTTEYSVIPILPDNDDAILSEEITLEGDLDVDIDHLIASDDDDDDSDEGHLSGLKSHNELEKLFALSQEHIIPQLTNDLFDVEGQSTNWLLPADILAIDDNHEVHYAVKKEAAFPHYRPMNSDEQLFELHYKEFFDDDSSLHTEDGTSSNVSDNDEKSVSDEESETIELLKPAMSDDKVYETYSNDLPANYIITEEKIIEHPDPYHKDLATHKNDYKHPYIALEQPNFQALVDNLLGRMSTFFTQRHPITPSPLHRIIQAQQPRKYTHFNHLANFKDSPLKDDHLKLETVTATPVWQPKVENPLWTNLRRTQPTLPAIDNAIKQQRQKQSNLLRNWLNFKNKI